MSRKSVSKKASSVLDRLYRILLYVSPMCLYLSFHPVIRLGENESMYFELSVAEIWLVVLDVVGLMVMMREKVLFRDCKKWWKWVLVPVWMTLSVAWSLNVTRGVLTVGLIWCVVMAVYTIWTLRDRLDAWFWQRWWKWFLGSTLVVCLWCVMQCVLDLAGVPQSCSLLCDGCTYRMFGFPHPNGFAIEPQFMGNLLLAPAMASAWLWMVRKQNKGKALGPGLFLSCFFAITVTLFLTFSRGAIYAFVVGMVVLGGRAVMRSGKRMWKRVGLIWLVMVGGFAVSLLAQGVMAEVSPTAEGFLDGVNRVVNHLSLGVIDVRGGKTAETEVEPVEKPVENSEGQASERAEEEKSQSVFDGYVAESTDTRVRLAGAAVKVWSEDAKTMAVGVGIGGAGQALYNHQLSPAPREIVQNEYASILLETGIVGAVLSMALIIMIVMKIVKLKDESCLMLGLLAAYVVSLVFFSGLPNALHIYILPIMLMVGAGNYATKPDGAN